MPPSVAKKHANILMVLQSDYPPDIRLAKEIKALTAAGHTVHLLSNNLKQRPETEVIDNAHVHRLKALRFLPARLAKIVRMPFYFNPLWKKSVAKLITTHSIDVIHVHDLPLAPLAVRLGKRFRLPVIYDMHENYPAAMAEWKKRGRFWQGWIKNPAIASTLNDYCLKHADRIIVVVEEQARNLTEQGIDPTRIHQVGNTVDLEVFRDFPINPDIIDAYKANYTILYLGSFSTERGLETAIEAVNYMRATIPHVKLLLVGDGKNRKDIEQYAQRVGVLEQVEFIGWVDFSSVPSYMSASDVCIIPQPSNPANDTTLPHKLFQYMALGKPVLTSDARPLKRIVEETRCGEWFESENAASFANAVLNIYNSDVDYASNGKKAVETKYNWEQTARELIRLYDEIFQEN